MTTGTSWWRGPPVAAEKLDRFAVISYDGLGARRSHRSPSASEVGIRGIGGLSRAAARAHPVIVRFHRKVRPGLKKSSTLRVLDLDRRAPAGQGFGAVGSRSLGGRAAFPLSTRGRPSPDPEPATMELAHHYETDPSGRRWLVVMHPDGHRHYRNPVRDDAHAAECLPILEKLIRRLDGDDDARRARIRAAYSA